MELVCDKAPVQNAISALHDICMREGAVLHDKLRMSVAGDGAIWLESTLPADSRDTLVSLPESCLPSLENARLAVEDGAIRLTERLPGLGDAQAECLTHMLAVYNATGKLAAFRETTPWFALQDAPALLDRLAAGRAGAPRVAELRERTRAGTDDAVLLDAFLGTRKYGAVKSAGGSVSHSVLMPFIDYANHHNQAPGFQPGDSTAGARHRVSLVNAKPIGGSDEVRVRYTPMDALDSYLLYGFVDAEADVLRSVPLTIDLDGGTIEVQARINPGKGKGKGAVPKQLADLGALLPEVTAAPGQVTASYLLVPEANRVLALRRTLNWLIRRLEPQVKLDRLRGLVSEAEAQILAANRTFLDGIEAEVAERNDAGSAPARAALEALVAQQRRHLDAYADRIASVTAESAETIKSSTPADPA